jgi:hypothetical protein
MESTIAEALSEHFKTQIVLKGITKVDIPPFDDPSQFIIKFRFAHSGKNYLGRYITDNQARAEFIDFLVDNVGNNHFKMPEYVQFGDHYYLPVEGGHLAVTCIDRLQKILTADNITTMVNQLQSYLATVDVSSVDLSDSYDQLIGYNFADEEDVSLMYTNISGNILTDGSCTYYMIDHDAFNILPTRLKFCPAFVELTNKIGYHESRLEGYCDKNDLDVDEFKENLKEFAKFEQLMGSDDKGLESLL